jgi:[ribosomal protein S5]-alanine N-acetyltransferase
MMELSQVQITTNRLCLKTLSMQYKQEIFQEFTIEITKYMNPCPPREIYDTESFIAESLEGLKNRHELVLVILTKDTQEFLGCTDIHRINSKQPELGIWLKKSAHNNAYGLEAISGIVEWAKENLDYF